MLAKLYFKKLWKQQLVRLQVAARLSKGPLVFQSVGILLRLKTEDVTGTVCTDGTRDGAGIERLQCYHC